MPKNVRCTTARAHRKKTDWAEKVAALLDCRYAGCAQLNLVCYNLNTHTKGAFYDAFPAEQARGYVKRIRFCYTPKHESWLNITENELSAMTGQCLERRIPDLAKSLQGEIAAWAIDVNTTQCGDDWQTKIDYARVKLKSGYPIIMA